MRIAREDLGIDELWVVHPGRDSWPMAEGIEAVAVETLFSRLDRMIWSGPQTPRKGVLHILSSDAPALTGTLPVA